MGVLFANYLGTVMIAAIVLSARAGSWRLWAFTLVRLPDMLEMCGRWVFLMWGKALTWPAVLIYWLIKDRPASPWTWGPTVGVPERMLHMTRESAVQSFSTGR